MEFKWVDLGDTMYRLDMIAFYGRSEIGKTVIVSIQGNPIVVDMSYEEVERAISVADQSR